MLGCDPEDTCEPATVYRLDLTETCYVPLVDSGLETCRSETEKGTEFACVERAGGEAHMAMRNTAAYFRGAGWQIEPNVSEETQQACEQIFAAVGYPAPANHCQ
jgi:hypothetical protein